MTIEQLLKKLILEQYPSIRAFTISISMAYSTMDSIFKRGINNTTLSNILKICKGLNISADALGEGKIQYFKKNTGDNDLLKIIETMKNELLNTPSLYLHGKPVDNEGIQYIIQTIDVGVALAEKKNIQEKE